MSEAPKRIWAVTGQYYGYAQDWSEGEWSADADCAISGGDDERVVEYIRADVSDALVAAAREEALRDAQELAHSHKGFSPAKAWSEDEREGYRNGQIDMQTAISNAILALITKDADNG
jgi:hypothetical protein